MAVTRLAPPPPTTSCPTRGDLPASSRMTSLPPAVVQLEHVRVLYANAPDPALACDALRIGPGLTLVLGANGAGKSTLLRVIAGVERPDAGRVRLDGHDAWRSEVAARARLAYVPEHPELSPYATIGEVVRLAAALRGLPETDAAAALARVGLDALAHRTVRELSMGQRRRALLATALAGDPMLVVLDEPLETMDQSTRSAIVLWVAERRATGATVVVATHDVEPFRALVDRVVTVIGGRVTEGRLPPSPIAGAQ